MGLILIRRLERYNPATCREVPVAEFALSHAACLILERLRWCRIWMPAGAASSSKESRRKSTAAAGPSNGFKAIRSSSRPMSLPTGMTKCAAVLLCAASAGRALVATAAGSRSATIAGEQASSSNELGTYHYTICGWIDRFSTWRHDFEKRVAAGGDVAVDLAIGARFIEEAADRAGPAPMRVRLSELAASLSGSQDIAVAARAGGRCRCWPR